MEGFLLRKNEDSLVQVLTKRWTRKYFVLDREQLVLRIYSNRPSSSGMISAAVDSNSKLEESIELASIDMVNYLRHKSKGQRFLISFSRFSSSPRRCPSPTLDSKVSHLYKDKSKESINQDAVFHPHYLQNPKAQEVDYAERRAPDLQRDCGYFKNIMESSMGQSQLSLNSSSQSSGLQSSISNLFKFSSSNLSQEADIPEQQNVKLTYTLRAPSARCARRWVRCIIEQVSVIKSMVIQERRSSRKIQQDSEIIRKKSGASKITRCSLAPRRRRSEAVGLSFVDTHSFQLTNQDVNIDQQRIISANFNRNDVVEIRQRKTAIVPFVDISSSSNFQPKESILEERKSGSFTNLSSRRGKSTSSDDVSLLNVLEKVEPTCRRSLTPSPRSSNAQSDLQVKRIIMVSPFKQELYDLFRLYSENYRSKRMKFPSIKDRTFDILQTSKNNPNSPVTTILKAATFEEFARDDESFSDDITDGVFRGKSIYKKIDTLMIEYFVEIPIDMIKCSAEETSEDKFATNLKNCDFWIDLMSKPTSAGGVEKKQKHFQLVLSDERIEGLRQGGLWNPKIPCVQGKVLSDWLLHKRVCFCKDQCIEFITKAVELHEIFELMPSEIEVRSHKFVYSDSSYYVLAHTINCEAVNCSEDDTFKDEEPSKQIPAANDVNRSSSELASEDFDDDDFVSNQILSKIVSCADFLDFFCALPNDASVIKIILDVRTSESRPSLSSALLDWKSLYCKKKEINRDEKEEHVMIDIMRQVLYEVCFNRCRSIKEKCLRVFEIENSESYGFGVDLYWEAIKSESMRTHLCYSPLICTICSSVDKQFIEFSSRYLASYQFSTDQVTRAILGALIDDVWYSVKPVAFNNHVVRPGIWKAFFIAMNNSEESLLEECLQDAFALILDNEQNAKNIMIQKRWISWFLPYLALELDEQTSRLFFSLISRLIYHSFFALSHEAFSGLLVEIILSIDNYVFPTRSVSLRIAYQLFYSVCGTLHHKSKHKFGIRYQSNPDPFDNLVAFTKLVFHFCTSSQLFGTSTHFHSECPSVEKYIELRKECGIHVSHMTQCRRICAFLQDLIRSLKVCEGSGAPQTSSEKGISSSKNRQKAEDVRKFFQDIILDFNSLEKLLELFQDAQDRLSKNSSQLSEELMSKQIRNFCGKSTAEKRAEYVSKTSPLEIEKVVDLTMRSLQRLRL